MCRGAVVEDVRAGPHLRGPGLVRAPGRGRRAAADHGHRDAGAIECLACGRDVARAGARSPHPAYRRRSGCVPDRTRCHETRVTARAATSRARSIAVARSRDADPSHAEVEFDVYAHAPTRRARRVGEPLHRFRRVERDREPDIGWQRHEARRRPLPTGGYATRMSPATALISSASCGVAQVSPTAPSATCRAPIHGVLCVLTCGRSARPCDAV